MGFFFCFFLIVYVQTKVYDITCNITSNVLSLKEFSRADVSENDVP